MKTLAEQLAEYAVGLKFEELPAPVVHEVKRRVIDSIGCALGAWKAEPCVIARHVASQFSAERGATLLGTTHRAPADWAVFANGCLVRYLDFNDTYLSKEPAHPSDNIPTALAAARLMRLDVERTRHAVGIAGVASAALRQSRVGELSHWKGCAFANAARHGVFAAMLAREGMTGPAPIFEGEKGFQALVSGPLEARVEKWGKGRDGKFMILNTSIKFWPAEYHSQSAIEAALKLRPQVGD